MKTPYDTIVFVHLYNDFSGSPSVLKEAIESLAEDDVERILLTSQHSGVLSGLNLKTVMVPYFFFRNRYLKLFLFLLSQFVLFWMLSYQLLKQRLMGRRVRLVINTILPVGALLAGRLFASSVLSYVHETSVQSQALSRLLIRATLSLSHERLYVSEYVRECLYDPSEKVLMNGLRSGFSPLGRDSLQEAIEQKSQSKCILFVGNLRPYKGFWVFVELAEHYSELQFQAVINSTQDEFDDFKEQYERWPMNLKVVLRPESLCSYYQEAYMLLNLSDKRVVQETFGMTILEGFAYGCPAVIPSVGGHLEYCADKNSLIADIGDFQSVVNKIDTLVNDPQRWAEMSYAAWLTALEMTSSNYKKQVRTCLLSL